jgi:hypothetical protein
MKLKATLAIALLVILAALLGLHPR